MPNAVLKISKPISKLTDIDLFSNDRGVFLYPVTLEHDSFFVRIYQKQQDRAVIKLEKTTMPKITSGLKEFILGFAKEIAGRLGGEVVHHNLNITRKTDYSLYDKYEIKIDDINKVQHINTLCSKKELNLEIGMGSGEFLTNEALMRKNESFIGVEILNNDFQTALRRFNSHKISNVKAIYYDARAVLSRFRDNSLRSVYINFPEPWFKAKKIKHSILTKKTACEIEKILKKDGELVILTDNHPFAMSSAAILENQTRLNNINDFAFITSRESIKTKYEKKWIKYQRTIYKLHYIKTAVTNSSEYQMPVFPIKIELKNITSDEYVFKILNIYKNRKNKKIIEIAAGYSNNPQHIFFALHANGLIDKILQSRFVINKDFIKAIALQK